MEEEKPSIPILNEENREREKGSTKRESSFSVGIQAQHGSIKATQVSVSPPALEVAPIPKLSITPQVLGESLQNEAPPLMNVNLHEPRLNAVNQSSRLPTLNIPILALGQPE